MISTTITATADIPVDASSNIVSLERAKVQTTGNGKRVCVFCSSSYDLAPIYYDHAKELGILLSQNGCALVYGGGDSGMMGVIASAAVSSNCPSIIGTIPDFMQHNVGRLHGQTVVANTLAIRKDIYNELSDVFIMLPGGFGSLNEFTEILTWNQYGIINKLIAILNTNGYYTELWSWCKRAVAEGFIKEIFIENIIFEDTPERLMEQILNKTPKPVEGKYFTKG